MRDLVDTIANPGFAIFALLFLFGFFALIVYWVFVKTPKSKHEKHAKIPLEDGVVEERKSQRGNEK